MIYAIQDGSGKIKIGRAKSPESRLSYLQTGNALELEILVSVDVGDSDAEVERNLHDCFANNHIRGEWFTPCLGLTIVCALLQDNRLETALVQAKSLAEIYKPPKVTQKLPNNRSSPKARPLLKGSLTKAERRANNQAKWRASHPNLHAANQRAYRARRKSDPISENV